MFANKHKVESFLANPNEEVSIKDGKILTLFLNAQRYFKFSGFEENFLINLIDFVKYIYFDFGFIEELVGREKVAEKVLTELKNVVDTSIRLQLLSYLKSKEIPFEISQYGLDAEIKDSILKGAYDYAKEVIELFYTENAPFLIEIANLYVNKNDDRHLLPSILDNLISLGKYNFVKDFLTLHYESLVGKKILEESKVIGYLIKSNGDLAFKKLKSIIIATKSNGGDTYYNDAYSSYFNPKSIDDLLDIAKHCLSLQDYETIFNGWFKPMRMVSETLASICKKCDLSICERALEEIMRINPLEDGKQNNRFYYENLINNIKDVLYKHKSKPFSMKQIMAFNEEYGYLYY